MLRALLNVGHGNRPTLPTSSQPSPLEVAHANMANVAKKSSWLLWKSYPGVIILTESLCCGVWLQPASAFNEHVLLAQGWRSEMSMLRVSTQLGACKLMCIRPCFCGSQGVKHYE